MPDTSGKKIRYYRQLKGISQQELADASGFFCGSIIRFENEQAPLSLDACKKIASAMSLEPSTLYDEYLLFISGNYGEKIKHIRNKMGLSQRKFAALLNVNCRTVLQWEKERAIPFRENVELILSIPPKSITVK